MGGIVPGWKWRWTRRITQSLAILAIVVTPFLGGWQRVDRSWLAAWDARGWDLPGAVMERLPVGTPAERAYQALQFIGGGTAGDYISIAAIDPVAGAVAFARTSRTLPVLIAWLIPIFLALLAGRVFCGWFCPFGTLARAIRALQARLPWHPRAFEIPHRRPVRWILLAAAVGGGALGADLLTFAVLPHALIQQTAYGAWLLGGGGAVLGSLAGLVLAGFVFGPTTYCAALCPTGAALSLVGRARLFHVGQETPRDCGHGCHLCDNACWLQLHPSTGDPGPDCDACTRCFSVCPRTNLRVGRGPSARPAALALIAGLGLIFVAGPAFAAREHPLKPRLVLNGSRQVGDVFVASSIVDYEGVRLDADAEETQHGIELSVFVARGALRKPEANGKISSRETYRGPLEVNLHRRRGRPTTTIRLDGPNSPASTPKRAIYRRHIDGGLMPDDELVIAPIPGWTNAPLRWSVPRAPGRVPLAEGLGFGAAAGFIATGLLAIALAFPAGRSGASTAGVTHRS